jgi:fucose 4-O-acetylase-like acetyltransferase
MSSDRIKPAWLDDIEQLKGFAIILVAWGHVHDPTFPQWALDLRKIIYEFHMPLFMYLSGFVFVYSKAHINRAGFTSFVSKRAKRLLVPFFVMAAIVILAKIAAQSFLPVHKPITDIFQSAAHVFVGTEKSPVLFIWYLFVLFIFSVLTNILLTQTRISIFSLFIIAIIMHFVHIVLFYSTITLDFLYLNRVIMYYVFFMAGCWACINKDAWFLFIERWWPALLIAVLALAYPILATEWRYFLVGLLASAGLHGFFRAASGARLGFFEYLGRNAFAIYLLNMLFIGFTTAILGKILPLADFALPILLIATICGVAGPILVKEAMKRNSFLKPVARAME